MKFPNSNSKVASNLGDTTNRQELVGARKRIAVVGAGWNGCHLALGLAKKGYEVTLFEKDSDIFFGISGKFGVRLHAGPHYPRSRKTQQSCQKSLKRFSETYPELINQHEYSIYGLGTLDVSNKPSKVTKEEFEKVCKASDPTCKIKDPETLGYRNLYSAIDIEEPTIVVGERLRETFRGYLNEVGIKPIYGFEVKECKKSDDCIIVSNGQEEYQFDQVINTTGYQSLLPNGTKLPFEMEIVYQPCLALVYRDKKASTSPRPFSFIVMDGWFPCIMPYDDRPINDQKPVEKYILTHGKWTIMGSYNTAAKAYSHLERVNERMIHRFVKPKCEADIIRFWPEFEGRFEYVGWEGAVLPKIRTDKEFRSAVTFRSENSGVIYVVSGKVGNVCDVEDEVLSLINNENVMSDGNYQYVRNGVLHDSQSEIAEKPVDLERNTCGLKTQQEYDRESMSKGGVKRKRNFTNGLIGMGVFNDRRVSLRSRESNVERNISSPRVR